MKLMFNKSRISEMNEKIQFIRKQLFLGIIGVLFSQIVLGQSWMPVGSTNFTPGSASYTYLEVNQNGVPHIAFMDEANSNKLSVMKYVSGSWSLIGPPGFTPTAITQLVDMDFDSNGNPWVIYPDNGFACHVVKFDGSNWVDIDQAGLSISSDFEPAIEFYNGEAYVAYSDWSSGNDGEILVKKFNGSNWVLIGTGGISAGVASQPKLKFHNGQPYVAYTDWSSGMNGRISVRKYDGSNWVYVGTQGFTNPTAVFLRFAVGSDGTPYVAFADQSNGEKGNVMKYNGSSWVFVGPQNFTAAQSFWIDIEVNNGEIYYAHQDVASGSYARLLKFNGTSWEQDGGNASLGSAYTESLDFIGNTPYMSFKDVANGNGASVYKYQPLPDFDEDGISDVNDVDKDNDGILDIHECLGTTQVTGEYYGTFGTVGTSPYRKDLANTSGLNGYLYTPSSILAAGRYGVSSKAGNNSGASGRLHPNANLWPLSMTGHTSGSDDDAFLAVNASVIKGVFFSEQVTLLPNTTYEYGAWATEANITPTNTKVGVRVKNASGVVIDSVNSSNLIYGWQKVSKTLNTGSETVFTVEVTNQTFGNSGNDFSIDDIFFSKLASNNCDSDGDGFVNSIDLDSDGDGCYDVSEAGHTDGNGDGILGSGTPIVDVNGKVLNAGGYTSSSTAVIDSTVIVGCFQPAAITSQPTNQSACAGEEITFEVGATGSDLSFQWKKSCGTQTYNQAAYDIFELNGTIYVGHNNGLSILPSGSSSWLTYNSTSGPSNFPSSANYVADVFVTPDGTIYIATGNGIGILPVGASSWTVHSTTQGASGFPGYGGFTRDIDVAADGTIYVAMFATVGILAPGATSWTSQYMDADVTEIQLVGNNLYVATNTSGVRVLNLTTMTQTVYSTTQGPTGLPENFISGIDIKDGVIYAATQSYGLAILQTGASNWTIYNSSTPVPSGFPASCCTREVAVAPDGTLYVSKDAGLLVLSPGSTSWQVYSNSNGYNAYGSAEVHISNGTPYIAANTAVIIFGGDTNVGTDGPTFTFIPQASDESCSFSVIITDSQNFSVESNDVTLTIEENEVTITCPQDISVNTDPGTCIATNVNLGMASASDLCGNTYNISNNSTVSYPQGANTVTWTADDNNGHTNSCTQTVTVSTPQNQLILAFIDADGDTYGNPNTGESYCEVPSGYVLNNEDCNDNDEDINPSVIENICDEIDNDCDGMANLDNSGPSITCPGNVNLVSSTNLCIGLSTLTLPEITDNCSMTLGNSLNFDGVNDIVNLGNTLGNFGTNNFTLEVWAKIPDVIGSREQVIMSKRNECTGNTFWNLLIEETGKVQFEANGTNSGYFNSTTIQGGFDDNNWHHYAWVRNGLNHKLYVDGILLLDINTSVLSNYTNTANLHLGKNDCSDINETWAASYLKGNLDEFRLWNVARSQSEIQNNMAVELSNQTNLTALHHFNQGNYNQNNTATPGPVVDTSLDDSGNNNNGSLVNFALNGLTSNWTSGIFGSVYNNAPDAYPVGITTVIWTTSDASGNTSTCDLTVTVTDTPPLAICQDITLNLDDNGQTSFTNEINNESSDNCFIAGFTFSQQSFSCNHLGNNSVTMTVTDNSDNSSTCVANVLVTGENYDNDNLPNACDTDDDNDGVADSNDCNPLNENIYQGAKETCDGLDNDCDGLVDEGTQHYYVAERSGGKLTKISTTGVKTTLATISAADGVVIKDGTIAYVSRFNATGTTIISVNLHTGATANIASLAGVCQGMDLDVNGNLLVTNEGLGKIQKINLTTNTVTDLATGLNRPNDVMYESATSLLITEYNLGTIIRYNTITNTKTNVASGMANPTDIFREASGNLLVAEGGGSGALSRINLTAGTRTVIATLANHPHGIAGFDNNHVLVTRHYAGSIMKVNLSTGASTVFASGIGNPVYLVNGSSDLDVDNSIDFCDDDIDNDGDYNAVDCSPTNPLIYSGASEMCDGVDNDCDNMVDEMCPPVANCFSTVKIITVTPANLLYNGSGLADVYYVPTSELDNGSFYSGTPTVEVARLTFPVTSSSSTSSTFNWTTNGACTDVTPGGGITNEDKGYSYETCLPVTPQDFNKIRNYKLRISDQYGSSECVNGKYKIIYSSGGSTPVNINIDENALDEINEDDNQIISIYPNPGKDVVNISLNIDFRIIEEYSISILDVLGKEVKKMDKLNSSLFSLSTEDLPTGAYTFMLKSGKDVTAIKWIKCQ